MPHSSPLHGSVRLAPPRNRVAPKSSRRGFAAAGSAADESIARISALLGVRTAVLQRRRGVWTLFGDTPDVAESLLLIDNVAEFADATGVMWTGIAFSDWILMVPGAKAEWTSRIDLAPKLEAVWVELSRVRGRQRAEYVDRAATGACMLGRRLARITDRRLMYGAIIKSMASAIGAEYGALAVFSREEGALRIEATHGYPQSIVEHVRIAPGEGILGRVFVTGRPLLVGGDSPGVELPRYRRHRTQSCVVLPLGPRDGVIGVAALADPLEGQFFEPIDLRVLRLFATPATLALQRERLRDDVAEVSRTAMRDPVTGLANRQYLETRLRGEMQRARRLMQPLAVMLVDVDDFKRVNDTVGHLEGDRVLRRLATLLTESVRIFDVCTRYGGDEFVVLMPGSDGDVAVQIAERVRRTVEHFYRDDPSGVHITVSAGVARFKDADTPETFLGRADKALFAAKIDRKNVVRLA